MSQSLTIQTSENSCCIQLNGCLSWYQVHLCSSRFRLSSSHWSRFALTGSFTIHLTCGKKFTNVLLERAICFLVPASCKSPSDLLGGSLTVLTPLLISICLSSSPSKLVPWGWNYGEKWLRPGVMQTGFSSQWDRFLIGGK